MNQQVFLLWANLVFPEGIAPGEDRDSNSITIARNGQGMALLRGTSLAGALRSAYRTSHSEYETNLWFGRALDSGDDKSQDSLLKVPDIVLNTGQANVQIRTHNAINRHTGSVIEGGLFSIEVLPPGTGGICLMEICDNSAYQLNEANKFIQELTDILSSGLSLGGNRNRGIGRMMIDGHIHYAQFDLTTLNSYADWLDSRYRYLRDSEMPVGDVINPQSTQNRYVLEFNLNIPRGEDFVVGYGATMDYTLEPQIVTNHNGQSFWRIPGSSLRGIFRAWMTRLAARDGAPVCDSAEAFHSGKHEIKGDNLGWAFVSSSERKAYRDHPDSLDDPILSLFGSLYARGRIHFSDAFSSMPATDNRESVHVRKHVAIDRFSGGANEGMLFTNKVLVASNTLFCCRIEIDNPTELEIDWIVKTLKALHLGVLSVGSSKGSGRIKLHSIQSVSESHRSVAENLTCFLEAHHE